eukprot:2016165-Rhodomonas_salina.1
MLCVPLAPPGMRVWPPGARGRWSAQGRGVGGVETQLALGMCAWGGPGAFPVREPPSRTRRGP